MKQQTMISFRKEKNRIDNQSSIEDGNNPEKPPPSDFCRDDTAEDRANSRTQQGTKVAIA